MIIDEKNKRELKAYLLRELCVGSKWLAFDDRVDYVTRHDVQCFRTLRQASAFCERVRDDCYGQVEPSFYDFKNLAATLRAMSGVSVADKIDVKSSMAEIARHPLESFSKGENLVTELGKGELCPVLYQKKVDLSDIENFRLIAHSYPKGSVYEIGHGFRVLKSCKELDEGLSCLKNEAAQLSVPAGGQRPELLLIGEIKNKTLQLDYEVSPDKNTGFVFARANPKSFSDARSEYEIQSFWTGKPFDFKEPMLAKFNTANSNLEFYDGNLKKVSPKDVIEYIDLRYFDSSPAQIVNLKKTIAGDERLNQEEAKQRLSYRLRHQ